MTLMVLSSSMILHTPGDAHVVGNTGSCLRLEHSEVEPDQSGFF